jgi:tRNA(Ile)-lysidine synthase
MHPLVEAVRQTIVNDGLIRAGDRVVVAVSGGPDSVALLHMLSALSGPVGFSLSAAHVDHRFRGEESAREADAVRRLARQWGIECDTAALDVPAYMKRSGLGPQEAAREVRYDFLIRTACARGANRIAFGHHADDQAETLLMRLVRGAGPGGLSGMPPFRELAGGLALVRPLLRIYKKELVAYCEEHGIPYVVDSSNLEPKYFRNRIRLELIPQLERYNPRVVPSLVRLSELLAEEDRYLDEQAERALSASVCRTEEGCSFRRADFAAQPVALQRRWIKLILSYLSTKGDLSDFQVIEAARTAALSSAPAHLSLDLGGGVTLVRDYEQVRILRRPPAAAAPFEYVLQRGGGRMELPEAGGASLEWREAAAEEAPTRNLVSEDGNEAWFDADGLAWPLRVRSRRPGDRLLLAGTGHKKVKDLLIDLKIPRADRDRLPLVVDAEGRVLWIPGVRRSGTAWIGKDTRRILHMKFHHDIQ